jgi:predicted transcriptional regulator
MMKRVRMTIDLPDELHRAATSLARDRGQSLSRTVADLVRAGLVPGAGEDGLTTDVETGLPLLRLGHVVTTEMVRAAVDEG